MECKLLAQLPSIPCVCSCSSLISSSFKNIHQYYLFLTYFFDTGVYFRYLQLHIIAFYGVCYKNVMVTDDKAV